MRVNSSKRDVAELEGLLYGGHGEPVLYAETEFAVRLSGLDVAMCLRLYPGRYPQQNVLFFPFAGRNPIKELKLVKAIDDNPADAVIERKLEFHRGLVITVQVD